MLAFFVRATSAVMSVSTCSFGVQVFNHSPSVLLRTWSAAREGWPLGIPKHDLMGEM
jgi:hypothetical protein